MFLLITTNFSKHTIYLVLFQNVFWVFSGMGNPTQRFSDWRLAGFFALMFMRSKKLSVTTKLSAEHESPPIANVLFSVGFLIVLFLSILSFCLEANASVRIKNSELRLGLLSEHWVL